MRQASMTQIRFLRARVKIEHVFPKVGAEVSLDTELALKVTLMAAERGSLTCCAACGTEQNGRGNGSVLTTEDGRVYVYRLCASCEAAWGPESQSMHPPFVNGRPVGLLFSTRVIEGPIGKRVGEALDQFVADGEPVPDGWG
jgi:hypothetical protein